MSLLIGVPARAWFRRRSSRKALSGPARGPHGRHGGSRPGPAGQVLRAYPPRRPVHPASAAPVRNLARAGAGRAARRPEARGAGASPGGRGHGGSHQPGGPARPATARAARVSGRSSAASVRAAGRRHGHRRGGGHPTTAGSLQQGRHRGHRRRGRDRYLHRAAAPRAAHRSGQHDQLPAHRRPGQGRVPRLHRPGGRWPAP
jgi:hypothetical protein